MTFAGVSARTIAADGSLVLQTANGTVVQHKPLIYQEHGMRREVVNGSYRLASDGSVGFTLSPYDTSRPLVIDPTLVYGTWIGGSSNDEVDAVAVDGEGAAYVTGTTSSVDFPATGSASAAGAVFVTKIAPDGNAFLYSTATRSRRSDRHSVTQAVDCCGSLLKAH